MLCSTFAQLKLRVELYWECGDVFQIWQLHIYFTVYGVAPANEVANASKSGPLVVIAAKCTTSLFARVVEIRPMGEDGDQAAAASGGGTILWWGLLFTIRWIHLVTTWSGPIKQMMAGTEQLMIICISSISRNTQVMSSNTCCVQKNDSSIFCKVKEQACIQLHHENIWLKRH